MSAPETLTAETTFGLHVEAPTAYDGSMEWTAVDQAAFEGTVVENNVNTIPNKGEEEYARSLSALRSMGATALRSTVEYETAPAVETAFDNYTSALREMLRTDSEFRGLLDIDDKREHDVVDGTIRDKNGVSMVEVVAEGRKISEEAAAFNPELEAQVERDRGDEIVARRVDQLKPGESLFALSMEPKEELQKYRKTYRGLGYREGLSYLQWYSRTAEGTLVAGSFSVDMSDEHTWREMFADLGVDVPEDESPNTWIQHTITQEMTAEEAEQFVQDVRHEYYRRLGVTDERQSVTEYVEANAAVAKGYFDAYYPALAAAVYSGQNNETLQGLAAAILETDVTKLKPEVREQLSRVANSEIFDDELGKTMDSVIRYAVVEELRTGLDGFVSGEQPDVAPALDTDMKALVKTGQKVAAGMPANIVMMHQRLAGNVEAGVKAGRSYGGCSEVELSKENADSLDSEADGENPQDAYGGKDNPERKRSKKTRINCLKCRQPTTIGAVEQKDKGTWKCPHCKYEIDVCTGEVKNEAQLSGNSPDHQANKPSATEPEAKPEPAPVISLEVKHSGQPAATSEKASAGPADTVKLAA